MIMNVTIPHYHLSRLDKYEPVASALDYLVANFQDNPSLEETAAAAGLSPSHFQRVFKAGAGVSPKRFLQYLAAGQAKRAITLGESVLGASLSAGLSGPSRLHDLFIASEAMTPGTYRKKGEGLIICYGFSNGPFGCALIGTTDKGICWLSFNGIADEAEQIAQMKADWPAANFTRDDAKIAAIAADAFAFAMRKPVNAPVGLYIEGTNFQLKVWEALLKIPHGELVT